MLFAEVVHEEGRARLKRVPSSRFLIIDGRPVRYIADDGTLLGVRRFVWGSAWPELEEQVRSQATR